MTDYDNTTQTPEDVDTQATQNTAPKKKKPGKNLHFIILESLIAIAILLFLIVNLRQVNSYLSELADIVAPIIIGLVFAYICNPILRFYEYVVFKKLVKNHPRLCRALSLVLTFLSVIVIVALVCLLVIPELIQSIKDFFDNASGYINGFLSFVNRILNKVTSTLGYNKGDEIKEFINLEQIQKSLNQFMNNSENIFQELLGNAEEKSSLGNLISSGFSFVTAVLIALKNVFIGCIIGIYLLSTKELRYAQIIKVRTALFSDKTNAKMTEIITLINKSFGGYFKGSLLDSIMVAIETWILFSIFRISDYNLLLATFIGITNIIPVFGPFIGAIPTGFIVLISNPSKFWLFVLLVIVIQQIDGNIIYPKILGNNTGISSLCVIIAITIMGNLFGIVGMVIGVPCFAVIVFLIKKYTEDKLIQKGKSIDIADYYSKNTLVSADEDLQHRNNFFIRFVLKLWDVLTKPFKKMKMKKSNNKNK